MVVGLPGLALAVLFLTVREPVRRGGGALGMPLRGVAKYLGEHWGAYLGMIGALSLMIFVSNSASAWIPAFLQRRFGWDAPTVGAHYGPLVLVCGAAGALAGGLVAVGLRRLGLQRANLIASLAGFGLAGPLAIAYPMASSAEAALAMIGAMVFAQGLTFGGGYAALQEMTPPRMRAQVTALNGLAVNLIGAGLGPLAVALVTDRVLADPQQIHLALSGVAAVGAPLVVGCFLLALRGHGAASQIVEDVAQGSREHP
jgi:hypothetical protein